MGSHLHNGHALILDAMLPGGVLMGPTLLVTALQPNAVL